MVDYAQNFKSYLVDEKKSSANTVESYMRDVTKFSAFCDLNRIKNLTKIDSSVISKYEDYMLTLGQSPSSVSRSLASLKCYFGFLVRGGIVEESPVIRAKRIATQKKLPEILTGDEVISLLNQPDPTECKGCRDKAMLELLYATGIKVSELISIKVSDINLQIGILHLQTKNSDRVIPIYPAAIKSIATYINTARKVMVFDMSEETLFTNMNGKPMTRQGFWKIIKQYATKAKIDKDITPHTLRHSFAAHLLENGAELTDIKEMLGYTDISSAQVYAKLLKNKYAMSYKRFHPLAR